MVSLYLDVVGNRAFHDSFLIEKNLSLWVVVAEWDWLPGGRGGGEGGSEEWLWWLVGESRRRGGVGRPGKKRKVWRRKGWVRRGRSSRLVVSILFCMAPGTVKMEVPESPMRDGGDTPSSIESSEVESALLSKATLTTTALGRKAAGAAAAPPHSNVHELLECPVCTNSMYPPIHQVLLWSLFLSLFCFFFFLSFFPLSAAARILFVCLLPCLLWDLSQHTKNTAHQSFPTQP